MRYISKVLATLLILQCLFNIILPTSYAWNQNDEIKNANIYIESEFGLSEYYTDSTQISLTDGNINRYGLNNQVLFDGKPAFHNKPLFLYGTPQESTDEYFKGKGSSSPAGKYSGLNDEWRTLGFTLEGCPFPNPWFPNDYYVENGKEVANNNDSYPVNKKPIDLKNNYKDDSGKYWIKDPYEIFADGKDIRELSRAMPDGTINKTIEKGTGDMIRSWVRTMSFQPKRMKNDRQLLSKMAVNPPKSVKNNFEDYLAVLSPPTDNSWGVGIAFYYKYVNSVLHSRYSLFYLRPKNMLKPDLYTQFEYESEYEPKKKIDPDEKVSVGITIDSSSEIALTGVGYKLTVKDDKGNPIQHSLIKADNLEMSADKMNLPASWTKFNVNFTMPNSPVNIEFSINPDGKNPDEDILSNNKISTRFVPNVVVPFDFDYNILSRSVRYPLENFDNTATLSLSEGSWNGKATGLLSVTNKTPSLLNGFSVEENPIIDSEGVSFSRNPKILTTFYRKDFGDKPIERKYIPGPQSITLDGYVHYGGSVKRPYTYTEYETVSNPDGTKSIISETITAIATGDFTSGDSKCKVTVYVYNGKELNSKKYIKDIIDNTYTNKDKKMLWQSKSYDFNVVRMMYHKDKDNNLINRVEVPGQFQRSFVNQNDANTNWKVSSSMKTDYKTSRDASKRMSTNKSLLKKAVFASDKVFQKYDYPIKSGYYFNPTGTYTFKITTNIFKTTPEDTVDHKEIVKAFLNAFRYESNIVYKNKNGQAVDIQNNSVSRGKKGYVGRSAVLSFDDPKGLDNKVWLEQTTTFLKEKTEQIEFPDPKNINELANSIKVNTDINSDDIKGMDPLWKEILEGYTESNTHGSFSNFRYREYVARKQTIYKITETSTVTIKVNPQDYKAYTHDAMADGDYKVKVYIDDISFKGHTNVHNVLEQMKGISKLDDIDIRVVGSKSDDINVN